MIVNEFVKNFYPGQIFVVTNTSIEKLNEECERVFPDLRLGHANLQVFEFQKNADGTQLAIVRKFVAGWSANPGRLFYD